MKILSRFAGCCFLQMPYSFKLIFDATSNIDICIASLFASKNVQVNKEKTLC